MKKLLLVFGIALGSIFTANANEYKLDDQNIDHLLNSSTEITIADLSNDASFQMDAVSSGATLMAGDKGNAGYFLRWFFCGSIALHRYYMGVGDAKGYMWALYLLVPVANCVTSVGDLIYPLVSDKGIDAYSNNSKWFVFF